MIEIQNLYRVPILFSFRFTFQNCEMDQDKKFECEKCFKAFKFKSILLLHSMRCEIVFEENNDSLTKHYNLNDVSKLNHKTEIKETEKRIGLEEKEYKVITDKESANKYQCKSCGGKFNKVNQFQQHYKHAQKGFWEIAPSQ